MFSRSLLASTALCLMLLFGSVNRASAQNFYISEGRPQAYRFVETVTYDVSQFKEVTVFAPQPPSIDGQWAQPTSIEVIGRPDLKSVAGTEMSPLRRPVVSTTIPLNEESQITVKVTHRVSVAPRRLIAGSRRVQAPEINPAWYMQRLPSMDYADSGFTAWMNRRNLAIGEGEDDVNALYNIYKILTEGYSYGADQTQIAPLSSLLKATSTDCGGGNRLMTATFLANGRPAYFMGGFWLTVKSYSLTTATAGTGPYHCMGRVFCAEAGGFITVDATPGRTKEVQSQNFGNPQGDYLAVHLNTDLILQGPQDTFTAPYLQIPRVNGITRQGGSTWFGTLNEKIEVCRE